MGLDPINGCELDHRRACFEKSIIDELAAPFCMMVELGPAVVVVPMANASWTPIGEAVLLQVLQGYLHPAEVP